jgi:hypothetical protein
VGAIGDAVFNLIAMLVFAAVIIGLEVLVMIVRGRTWGPMSIQIVGFSLIVLAVLILVAADLPADGRAPAYALLGVVAGFLAGKSGKEPD